MTHQGTVRYEHFFQRLGHAAALFEGVSEGTNFLLLDLNPAAERMYNVERDKVLGQPLLHIFPGLQGQGLFEVMQEVFRSQQPHNHPPFLYTSEGLSRWVETNIFFLPSGHLATVFADVTSWLEAQRERQEAYAIINRSPAVAFLWKNALGWPVEFVSPNVERLLGYTSEELTSGRVPYAELVHPEDLARVGQEVTTHSTENDRTGFTHRPYRLKTAEQTFIWVNDITYIRRSADGSITHYEGILYDITEQQQATIALRASEERYRLLVECLQEGIWTLDRSGKTTFVNPRMAEMLGYVLEEMLGQPLQRFIAERDQISFQKHLEQRCPEHIEQHDLTFLKKDGTRVYTQMTSTSLYEDKERYVGLLASVMDLTERKKMEAGLAQADRMANVGMLAAGVAHEINNPLTYILYNLENLGNELPLVIKALGRLLLLSGKQDLRLMLDEVTWDAISADRLDDLVACVRDATEGAYRVQEIVKDLKTFSRAEEKEPVPVSLNRIIDGAINMAYHEIKHRARLEKEYQDLPTILANDGQLAQVFLNLLVNAAQAIEEGDVEHNTIRIVTQREGSEVLVTVKDTGKGIPADQLPLIFEPFFSTKPAGVGSGLGLSICQKILTAYGGSLTVQSEVGQGTSFTVRFPLVHPEAMSQPATREETGTASETVRNRILVVEDEPHMAEVYRRALTDEHEVIIVSSVDAAEHRLEKDRAFMAIICEVVMPSLSGMDLYHWLNTQDPPLAARIIFISGGTMTARAKEFLRQVKNPRLEKPFEMASLTSWLRKMA